MSRTGKVVGYFLMGLAAMAGGRPRGSQCGGSAETVEKVGEQYEAEGNLLSAAAAYERLLTNLVTAAGEPQQVLTR